MFGLGVYDVGVDAFNDREVILLQGSRGLSAQKELLMNDNKSFHNVGLFDED